MLWFDSVLVMIVCTCMFQFGGKTDNSALLFGHLVVCNNTQQALRFGQVGSVLVTFFFFLFFVPQLEVMVVVEGDYG